MHTARSARQRALLLAGLLPLFLACAPAPQQQAAAQPQDPLLTATLRDGEAIVWYLGHAGWAVRTSQRLLIFDYVDDASDPSAGVSAGRITADHLQGLRVFVFVSHRHGDHYDAGILDWQRSLPAVKYLFGWKARNDERHLYFEEPRSRHPVDGMEVTTIHHNFDGIPEAAFLVRADGVAVYHSGDHGSVKPRLNPTFKENIDTLAEQKQAVDLAFLSVFGGDYPRWMNPGDLYTLEQLQPRVVLPMHCGGREWECEEWAKEARARGLKTEAVAAKRRGDWCRYRDGKIVECKAGLSPVK